MPWTRGLRQAFLVSASVPGALVLKHFGSGPLPYGPPMLFVNDVVAGRALWTTSKSGSPVRRSSEASGRASSSNRSASSSNGFSAFSAGFAASVNPFSSREIAARSSVVGRSSRSVSSASPAVLASVPSVRCAAARVEGSSRSVSRSCASLTVVVFSRLFAESTVPFRVRP